ncbi:hypothetical protein MRB53_042378 [Persea americana]|nr:hypothetical protein MRB53_042378 [Persea americana]
MSIRENSFMSSTHRKVHDHPLKPNRTPYALRFHGSVIRRVWPQVLIIGIFSFAITCISELGHSVNLGIQTTMISTLGFIVGLSLSFRTTTAYANWKEARQQFDKLSSLTRNLARIIWIHAPDDGSTTDLLDKKSTPKYVSLIHYVYASSNVPSGQGRRDFQPYSALWQSPIEITFHIASYMNHLKLKRGLNAQTYARLGLHDLSSFPATAQSWLDQCPRKYCDGSDALRTRGNMVSRSQPFGEDSNDLDTDRLHEPCARA